MTNDNDNTFVNLVFILVKKSIDDKVHGGIRAFSLSSMKSVRMHQHVTNFVALERTKSKYTLTLFIQIALK